MLCVLGFLSRHAYTVVVVQVLDGNGRILLRDVLKPGLGGALRHSYNTFLSQLVGGPCDSASVVSVGSGEEGRLTELFS